MAVSGRGGGDASRHYCAKPRSVGCVGGVVATNLVLCAAGPTSFICAGDMGPPTIVGLDAPDQGAGQMARWGVGPTREEINLTIPYLGGFAIDNMHHARRVYR